MDYSVVVVAAGKGTRTNLEYNKVLYIMNDGKAVIDKTLRPFFHDEECKQIVIVINPLERYQFTKRFNNSKIEYANGGETRQDSVKNGLALVNQEYVMIHDGARCFLLSSSLEDLKECLKTEDACLLTVPVTDTVKRVVDGYVVDTLVRSELQAAQTPQCFKTELIRECHHKAEADGFVASDDSMLVERYSKTKVKAVMGSYDNIKITTDADLR